MVKEGFHLFEELRGAQRAERQSLHLVLGLAELPRDLPFDVRPPEFDSCARNYLVFRAPSSKRFPTKGSIAEAFPVISRTGH